jgi:hypothetical protein
VNRTGPQVRAGSLLPSIELRFPPRRVFVSRIASMVRQFCRELIGDGDELSRVNMATHELVENVVKYSAGGICELRVEFRLKGPTPVVSIETANEVEGEALEDLEKLLVALQETTDPVAFYDGTIRSSAKRRQGSGLGLARVRAEGEMELSHRISEGRITIRAESTLTGTQWAV